MKRCIVCNVFTDRPDIFCDDHADMPNGEKLVWYKRYNYLIENRTSVLNLDEYSMVLIVPKKNAEGVTDNSKAKFLLNGKEMRIEPPMYIKIKKNMMVEMQMSF